MRPGGLFRFLFALLVLGAVAALMSGAYSAGYVAGAGTNAAGNSPWIYGGFFGASGIVGLFVTILIVVIIFRILGMLFWHNARRSWASDGPNGPNGPAGPKPGDWPYGWHGGWHARRWEARQAFLEDWHRRTHEAQASGGAPTAPNGGTQI